MSHRKQPAESLDPQKSSSPKKTETKKSTKTAPLRSGKVSEDHLAEALILLGVSANDIDACPKIEHLFEGIGGKSKVFQYLEGSEEADARKILDLRKRLNVKQAAAVPFEAYCLAAVISVKKMFGLIASECADQESRAKDLMFRARHTDIVKATIDNAMEPEGVNDRRMLHQAAGFVPVPKNSITHIHGNQITDNRQQTANIAVLPSVEDTTRRIGDRFNEKLTAMLPAATIVQLPAPEDDTDDEDE